MVRIKNMRSTPQILNSLFIVNDSIVLEDSLYVIVDDTTHVWPTGEIKNAVQVWF